MHRNEEEWIACFEELGALWMHDGNPKRPHALLTQGGHSNGFFNATLVTRKARLLAEACEDIIEANPRLSEKVDGAEEVVFGSASGAVTIAHEVARQLGVDSGYTQPVVTHGEKEMVLGRFEATVNKRTRVFVFEDVLTSGKTTLMTIAALEAAGATVVHEVFVLVNRSGMSHLRFRQINSLINRELPVWTSEECPLCEQGSEAIRPKDNWERLTSR